MFVNRDMYNEEEENPYTEETYQPEVNSTLTSLIVSKAEDQSQPVIEQKLPSNSKPERVKKQASNEDDDWDIDWELTKSKPTLKEQKLPVSQTVNLNFRDCYDEDEALENWDKLTEDQSTPTLENNQQTSNDRQIAHSRPDTRNEPNSVDSFLYSSTTKMKSENPVNRQISNSNYDEYENPNSNEPGLVSQGSKNFSTQA